MYTRPDAVHPKNKNKKKKFHLKDSRIDYKKKYETVRARKAPGVIHLSFCNIFQIKEKK